MARDVKSPTQTSAAKPASAAQDVADFLAAAKKLTPVDGEGKGRLVFALDATMSRQPTWDMACRMQADMFHEAASLGGLRIKLVYFRGLRECRASGWVADSVKLESMMSRITCAGGHTQIGRVLGEVRIQAGEGVKAFVFVGDAMEENLDGLCALAGELGLLGVRAFMFQEGHDANAETAFREIARLTGGAYCRFDPGAAAQLRDLLRAAAAFASGGRAALARIAGSGAGQQLLTQLR